MKFIQIGKRFVNTDRIDSVLMLDSRSARVWHSGRTEPVECLPEEVLDVQEYVIAAMYGGAKA